MVGIKFSGYIKMKRNILMIFLLAGVFLNSCRKPYEPKTLAGDHHFLVVDGILNHGDSTHIRLSRSRALDERYEQFELNAVVSVENEHNQRFLLMEAQDGRYSGLIDVNTADKYRLHIKTANGKEYYSDFVSVLKTPPIDTITWRNEEKGLQTYVSSHDPQSDTRYYRWDYEEAWSTAPFLIRSRYKYENGAVVPRDPPTPLICYGSRVGNSLLLASSAKLSEDIVQCPVNLLRFGAVQLSNKYSIEVKQYALEKKAYEYWLAMKKNTEQLGGISDPQPSYMYGNIYSATDPAEVVIGFFGACNVTKKRIFIAASDAGWNKSPVDPAVDTTCIVKFVKADPNPLKNWEIFAHHFGNQGGQLGWTPLDKIANAFTGQLEGYTAVKDFGCVQCPQISPDTVKPDYWD